MKLKLTHAQVKRLYYIVTEYKTMPRILNNEIDNRLEELLSEELRRNT